MDRRDFLTGSASLVAALITSSCSTRVPGYQESYVAGDKGKLLLGLQTKSNTAILRILDLNNDSFRDILIPIKPHSFQRSPVASDEILVIGFEDTAGIVNISSGETRLFRQKDGTLFNGHGTLISPDEIWCTETTSNGRVIARPRSTRDFSYLRDSKVSFEAGHHIVRLPGTTILASGTKSLNFYDYAKKEVIREISSAYVPVHLVPSSDKEVFVVTSSPIFEEQGESRLQTDLRGYSLNLHTPTPVLSFNISGESKIHWDEKRKDLFKFGLGIKKVPDGRILTGHTWSNSVICWNQGRIEKVINVPHPQALALSKDGSEMAVHFGGGG